MTGILTHLFGGRTFAHGIHPPELKAETSGQSIQQFPFAPLLTVPLSQHIGQPAVPVVGEGEEVIRGQCLAEPDGFLSVAIHAPASGVIRRIAPAPAINGRMEPAFFLEPWPASTQEVVCGAACCAERDDAETILSAIQQAGIVGLGGAGFPTHAKLTIPPDKDVDTVVVNGAECEPYLTTDHRVMLEQADDVLQGIRFVLRATGARRAIIAIEDNKQDAAEVLRRTVSGQPQVSVELLPVKYPQGAEKMLIRAVLGREVPSGGLPADVRAVCINVGTTAQIGQLLSAGQGLQERVVTVGGSGVLRKGNYRIPIGTTLRFILETVGTTDDISTVVMGGPMMGRAASNLDIPITKGATGVIACSEQETDRIASRREYPCIRCGSCLEACPLFLNPSQLGLLAGQARYDDMADGFHLMDCFECGCCTFVCPSHIPLVQKFRVAKAAVKKQGAAG